MEIRLFNSWSDQIEIFAPIKPGQVSMYVCGPTVYDFVHIGNMRPVVVFDVLRRLFEYLGYQVTFVSNYTDIDDKIIAKAFAEKKSEREVADFFIKAYEENVALINSELPTVTPRVTGFVSEIVKYIEGLVDKGSAYVVDGEVFFSVASIPEYGRLSHMKTDDLIVGARVEESGKKRSPLDFFLWKKTDRGITFDSPWGKGRPGWHTECAVMIDAIFHEKIIDIHGGGFDLKFPHHDNEIAQSMAQHGTRLANIWMHNGFINLNDDKMSKSTGNFLTAKEALATIGGPALRLMLLSTHYRLPVNFNQSFLATAQTEVNKMKLAMKQLAVALQLAHQDIDSGSPSSIDEFIKALADDLNTSNALTSIYETIKLSNRALRESPCDYSLIASYFFTLRTMFHILGLDINYPRLTTDDRSLFERYQERKAARDYEGSDALRSELIRRNIL
jgi:cysteinyl-tRNA synthetase